MIARLLLGLGLFAGLLASQENASAAEDDAKASAYVKVEVKGELTTGVFAIGGETTGTIIKAGPITWELDVGKKDVSKMNGKDVIVTGELELKKGVEIRQRWIVHVKTIKPAK